MDILCEELVKKGNDYELIIHLSNNDVEFSKELSTKGDQETSNYDIFAYVKRKYPNIKVNVVKLMVGGILLTSFTIGQTGVVFAAPKDIDNSSEYAKAAIKRLVEQEIIVGDDLGNFNPKSSMDRDAFTTLLVKAMDLDIVTPDVPTFKDVQKTSWAYSFVETGVANNLISGVGNNNFAPKNHITREQMAVILVRSLGLSVDNIKGMGDQLTFIDTEDISSYALDYVGFAVTNGLFRGDENNHFLGKDTATREQVAVVIDNFLTNKDNLQKTADTIKNITFSASVTQNNLTSITLDFSKSITSLVPEDIIIKSDNDNTLSITNIALSDDGKSATLTTNNMTSDVDYTISIDKDNLKGESTVTPRVIVTDLSVKSLSIIDDKNILVEFNDKVEPGAGINGAENISNYTIIVTNSKVEPVVDTNDEKDIINDTTPEADNIIGTKLREDGTSVILTLNEAMINDTIYTITVNKNIMNIGGKALSTTTDYSDYLLFPDQLQPRINNLYITDAGAIKIEFSERLSVKPDEIVLNGQTINPNSIAFVPKDDFVTIPKDAIPENVNLKDNYTIAVNGAKDIAGNTMVTMIVFKDAPNYIAPEVEENENIDEVDDVDDL